MTFQVRATYTDPAGATVVLLDQGGFDSLWAAQAAGAKFTQQRWAAGLPFGGFTVSKETTPRKTDTQK